ncbi:MAG: peptidylprolyl isomerase [Alphaproteobacteria bacterium]|nr:peptidylprolyl isomerase [Alphaproteobacteria bacterium]
MIAPFATRLAPPRAPGLKLIPIAALAAVLLLPAGGTPALSQADPVVAKVNGAEIRQSDIDLAEEDLGQQAQQMTAEAKREYLVGYVADIMLAAKMAEGKKVTDQREFKQRLAFIRNKLMMELMLQAEGKAAATDQAMRKVYDEAITQMAAEMEVRARHILVATEAEAKAVLAELKKGTDFAELAKLKSKDPGAAAEGGDLGYFAKDQMVPEFADAAFKLEKGQLSEPVKSQFGWHVIRVEDKRKKPAPEFEKVKEQLETFVARRAQAEIVAKLREGAKIERLDKR